MKKDNTTIYFEFDNTHKNFNTLFDISKELDHDKDYPIEIELTVNYNWYYDKGKSYGEPENCYPPEFDFEVTSINCGKIEVTDLLEENEIENISQEIIENLEI